MCGTLEVNIFDEHVRGEDQILTLAWTEDSGIVTDAQQQTRSRACAPADTVDKLLLVQLNAPGEYQP
jgi:hypothetical protein